VAHGITSLRGGEALSRSIGILILILCALLEAGADAVIRRGMASGTLLRAALYLCGAAMLFSYGWLVNRPTWSFGSLLGLYIVVFFLISQLIAFFVFGERPNTPILAGGALIVAGGFVIALAL
jgi:small multidrug resistance family-3 protein